MMIYVIPNYDKKSKKELYKFVGDFTKQGILSEEYILRVVSSTAELIEKILINDFNFDDRIIEILKVIHIGIAKEQVPNIETEIKNAYFNVNNGQPQIIFFLKDGRTFLSQIKMELYKDIEKSLSRELNKDNSNEFREINLKWARRFIKG